MAIHATERYANVRARLTGYLSGLTVHGSPTWTTELQQPVGATEWARVTYIPQPETWSGQHSSGSAAALDARVLVTVDLFYHQDDTGTGVDLYAVDRAADDVAYGLREMSLSFLDYATTPATPSAVTGERLRCIDPPTIARFDPSQGRARRQITAEVRWVMRH